MRLKIVNRFDPREQKYRVARFLWQKGDIGLGGGYSAKLSFSLRARFWTWEHNEFGWRLIVGGIELHLLRSWGGIIV